VAFERLERDTGIKAKFVDTGGPPNTAAGLLNGDIDIGSTSPLAVVRAIDQGADLKIVLAGGTTVDFALYGRGDVRTPADLKGKRIAGGPSGAVSDVVARFALDQGGLDEDDVKLSALDDGSARAAAMEAERVDAAALEYPDAKLLEKELGPLSTIASLHDGAPFLVADVWVVKGEFARREPELLRRVVRGLVTGYESLYTPGGRTAWLKQAEAKAEPDEKATVEQIYDRQKQTELWPRADEAVTAGQHAQAIAFWRDLGLLEEEVPFGEVWDTQFWTAAGS
jgi:ABC-type nitrate/sulfonate/bicarbonate transport system substrate-binding protein